jgi:hypothetical protein
MCKHRKVVNNSWRLSLNLYDSASMFLQSFCSATQPYAWVKTHMLAAADFGIRSRTLSPIPLLESNRGLRWHRGPIRRRAAPRYRNVMAQYPKKVEESRFSKL